MSGTPRTDAECWVTGNSENAVEVVTSPFARQLETELSAALNVLADKERELAAMRELHDVQLAAISTACVQNTRDSATMRIWRENPYWTVAYGDVCVAVDREMAERARAEKAERELAELRQRDTCGREALAGLRKELDEARREIERLTGVITGDAGIKQLVVDEKGLRLAASHPMMHALACEMASFFKSAGGINYVELSMCHQEEGPFVLTLQRREGKTPNDLKAEAEKERDAAREAIRGAVRWLEKARCPNCGDLGTVGGEQCQLCYEQKLVLDQLRFCLTGAGEKGGEGHD